LYFEHGQRVADHAVRNTGSFGIGECGQPPSTSSVMEILSNVSLILA